MRSVLKPYADAEWTLITGAQRGADLTAEAIWRGWQCRYIGVPAKWAAAGNKAGPQRNRVIASQYHPQLLVHFPGDVGTADAVRVAGEYGIEALPAVEHE
jgi:hypothetical protein